MTSFGLCPKFCGVCVFLGWTLSQSRVDIYVRTAVDVPYVRKKKKCPDITMSL